jgi:hypothetical protein
MRRRFAEDQEHDHDQEQEKAVSSLESADGRVIASPFRFEKFSPPQR